MPKSQENHFTVFLKASKHGFLTDSIGKCAVFFSFKKRISIEKKLKVSYESASSLGKVNHYKALLRTSQIISSLGWGILYIENALRHSGT